MDGVAPQGATGCRDRTTVRLQLAWITLAPHRTTPNQRVPWLASIPEPARFSVEHVHIYRVADGRLAEHWVARDDLTMLRQLHPSTG
jgi:SnoaL-like polyketide cyclase